MAINYFRSREKTTRIAQIIEPNCEISFRTKGKCFVHRITESELLPSFLENDEQICEDGAAGRSLRDKRAEITNEEN